jgi:NAD(P)-dependent dehydrogenase (short-subunit alcohol dehydrogenase family)
MRRTQDLLDIKGRVALVTGGAGHLGLAFGETLAEAGAMVVVVDRDQAACDERAGALRAHGAAEVLAIAVDLAQADAAARAVDACLSKLGRLDIVVNNAAFTGASGIPGYAVPFPEQSLDAWDAALRVNLTAPFLLAQAARAALAASGHGVIVNVSSIYGRVGPNLSLYESTTMGNPAAYGASKAALEQLTRYLATSLAPRIRVNAIAPGGVERGQPESFRRRYEALTPLGRMACEEDFKAALLFLASDASAYVTGQVLMVDGGFTAW